MKGAALSCFPILMYQDQPLYKYLPNNQKISFKISFVKFIYALFSLI